MLSREDLLLFERKFSDINIIATSMILIYDLLFITFGNLYLVDEIYTAAGFVAVVLVDFIFVHFLNSYNDNLKKVLKYIMLLLLGWTALLTGSMLYSTIIAMSFYFSVSFQSLFLFDITEPYSRIWAVVFTCSPVSLIFFIGMICNDQSNFMIFIIVITLCAVSAVVYNITCRLSEFALMFFNKINSLNGIAAVSKEESDSIKIQKDKLEQINEQLSIERFKFKQANEIILKNNEEIKIQNTIVNAAAKALDLKKLLEYLTEATMVSMKLDFVSFLILTDEEGEERFEYSSRYTKASSVAKSNLERMETRSFAEAYVKNGAIVEISRDANQNIDELSGTNINSMNITPAVINENSMGLYMLGSINENAFLNNEAFLKSLFNHISLAINNAILYSRMRTMAVKDGLTGIYNRRYFNSIYQSIIHRCIRNQSPLTIILFDIDKFKGINDTYGHIFGDEVIRYCGQTALRYGRKYNGLPVRYGGEEFIIVFPKKSTAETESIMQELHTEIKTHVFHMEEKNIGINISIGIASYPENCRNTEELLNAADNAMYASKKNGRGRITIYNKDIMA